MRTDMYDGIQRSLSKRCPVPPLETLNAKQGRVVLRALSCVCLRVRVRVCACFLSIISVAAYDSKRLGMDLSIPKQPVRHNCYRGLIWL